MDNQNYYIFFSILFFLIPTLFILKRRRDSKTSLRLPPGPHAWPIIGNLLSLDAEKPHLWLASLARKHGSLFSLRLGPKVLVVASSPEAAKEVLKTCDRDLSGRFKSKLIKSLPEFQNSVIVLSTECSEKWRSLRKNAHVNLFSHAALESHAKLRAQKSQEMLEFLAKQEGEIEIVNIVYTTVVNILTNTLMSSDLISSLDHPVGELKKFSRMLIGFVIPTIADLYPMIGGFLDHGYTQRVGREYKEKRAALWGDIVSQRRTRKVQETDVESNQDFLDYLINHDFDDGLIYNAFSEFFVTADSISITMEWAMAELTKNQEALSQLRDEVIKAVEENGKFLSENQIANLPYLQACIKETLRLHPPSPFLVPHCALESCKVMNYRVPKDSLLAVNIHAIGRDPEVWEDPLSFKPERFLGKKFDLKGTYCELLPFGGGRRICTGIPLAMKEIQLLLSSLVYAFDWVLPFGTDPTKLDMSDKFSVPLGRAKPLLLVLKKRNNQKII